MSFQYKVMPGTKYRKVQSDETLRVMIDVGNSDVKAMIFGHYGEEIYFPHAVLMPTPEEYGQAEFEYKNHATSFEQTAVFKHNGKGFFVGKHAEQTGEANRELGADKYTRDQMGVLAMAALLMLYPDGHKDVRLVTMHPAGISTANMKALYKSLTGEWKLILADKREVIYKVTEIVPLMEAVAAFQTFVLTNEGEFYKRERFELKPGMQFLIFDVGGWISSIVPGIVTPRGRLEVNTLDATRIRIGIQDIYAKLEKELKRDFKEIENLEVLPIGMLQSALSTNQITIFDPDSPEDCSEAVNRAMPVLTNEFFKYWSQKYNSGVGWAASVVGGGGGGITFEYLRKHFFKQKHVYTVDEEIARMRFGTIRGASKGQQVNLRDSRRAKIVSGE